MKKLVPLTALALGLGLTLPFTDAASARTDEFERRLAMLDALEAGNYDEIGNLVKEDEYLDSYCIVLSSVANGEDATKLDKMLTLQALDRASPDYKPCVASVYGGHAGGNDLNIGTLKRLLDEIQGEQEYIDLALRLIFSTAAKNMPYEINPAGAALLIQNGADPDEQASRYEYELESAVVVAQQKLEKFAAFKQKVIDAAKPAP